MSHATDSMTIRERWLAALRLQPVDRLPFWPKLGGNYARNQAAPFDRMSFEALHAWLGSDPHTGIGDIVREVRHSTRIEARREGDDLTTIYATPYGDMQSRQRFDTATQSWHPLDFPIRDREDIRRMTAIYEDVAVELDAGLLETARAAVAAAGDGAITAGTLGTTALMRWIEWLAGIEAAHLMLADYPDAVETLFAAMQRVLLERARLHCEHHPADVLYLVENTSTTLISPDQYQRYGRRQVGAVADLTHAAGRLLILHMCGHLKALLPDLARIPAQAFEAFTAPTLGNTSLLDGRRECPNQCLIGGTHAMLWTQPVEAIIARIEHDLDELPHHRGIVVTSAGVMPPHCRPETIRRVADAVHRYPVRPN